MNDLRDLLRESAASPPRDHFDLPTVLAGGRRRVRRRRLTALVGTALATAVVVLGVTFLSLRGDPHTVGPAGVPQPDAPTVELADATRATEGTDYRDLFSSTNENLDRDNGQYLDGVTADGLVLFRDGPREGQWWPRYALVDPATGTKDWLPRLDIGQTQAWPVELGTERLVLLTADGGTEKVRLVVHVLDRGSRQWSRLVWPDLPRVGDPFSAQLGPDGRLYVRVPATQGEPPPGGWPTDASGEADDADAEGDTYRLWSASMRDPSDVRDEGLTVGSLAFGEHTMVWTDGTNGHPGQVHVRDLATGDEHAFDPHTGSRCNLLGFGTTDERVVMSQYCGTYDGVRDDRVQVLGTDGHQVVTLQGNGIDGGLATGSGPGVVTVSSYESGAAGTYAYDLGSGRFLRLSDDVAKFAGGAGLTTGTEFLYSTPVNHRHGMVEHVAELLD